MNCAWEALLSIIPHNMRNAVNTLGRESMQELRLRLGNQPEIVCNYESKWLTNIVTIDDISFVINAASRYSPWSASTVSQGYITAQGGHRVGICGECVVKSGQLSGIHCVQSVCIRVARDFPGIGQACDVSGSILILGPPGSGKTTLLRDLVRHRSNSMTGSVTVVDERGEIFPIGANFNKGIRTDVLCGCSKAAGLDIALRAMGSRVVAVDEITAKTDCDALLQAAWCGVDLFATAHAECIKDLSYRSVYRTLYEMRLFETILVLGRDKSWRKESIVA